MPIQADTDKIPASFIQCTELFTSYNSKSGLKFPFEHRLEFLNKCRGLINGNWLFFLRDLQGLTFENTALGQ
jgi:hypothetical protein